MRAAIYARVSTNNAQDPSVQTRELREYCQRRGWEIAGEYVDAGVSGAKDSRPELNKLNSDAHRRQFDAVVVWKFDRFARSVSHLLRALETFQALGIEFVSLTEGVDTSTPAGKMVFTVLGAVAELERSLIRERVRAGLRNARAKGKKWAPGWMIKAVRSRKPWERCAGTQRQLVAILFDGPAESTWRTPHRNGSNRFQAQWKPVHSWRRSERNAAMGARRGRGIRYVTAIRGRFH
jgi:DNA invertase Pin-like site-specific DNA recombinase